MSEKTIPMEVEEAGIDDYMLDFQGMLDRLDSPSEVQGEGVGDCAGGEIMMSQEEEITTLHRYLKILAQYKCAPYPAIP